MQIGNPRRIRLWPIPLSATNCFLQGTAAAVIDVLRATTVYVCAVQSGAKEIIPVLDIADAIKLKSKLLPNEVLLGGERQGLPIEGFDLGNSPQHYTQETVSGKTVILTTTNGTAAMHAARSAGRIYLACFLNADAVVERLQFENDIAILCAGTNGKETEEDMLLAGCLISRLIKLGDFQLNADARRAAEQWTEPAGSAELEKRLRKSTGGKNLIRIGLEADIAAAAQIDTVKIVPQWVCN